MAESIRLQPNDLDVFAALLDGRFLTTALIADEFYSHRNAANRRLKQLADQGYIAREQRSVTQEAIWRPTKRAETALVKAGRLARDESSWTWKQGQSTLFHQEHESDVNRLRLAWIRGAGEWEHVAVAQCLSGARLHDSVRDRDGRQYPVRPDRFLRLRVEEKHSLFYFAEVDRGTKTLRRKERGADVARQLYAYTPYFSQGAFARKYGRKGDRAQDWPFGVLVTAPTATRRNNLIATMVQEMRERNLELNRMRGYALFDEAVTTPYEQIWVTEKDVAVILDWLQRRRVDEPLALKIPPETHNDLRQKLGAEWLKRPYRRSIKGKPPLCDLDMRDAVIDALVATKRLPRFGLLDTWTIPAA